MLYRIFMVNAFAVFFTVMYFIGKEKGRRLGFKEGVEAVKIVHCEAIKADSDYCKKELEKVFAEIESFIDYIEEQLDEVPDCFDALKRDIEHIKSQTLGKVASAEEAEDVFDFFNEESERDFVGGEIIEPKSSVDESEISEEYDCRRCCNNSTPYCKECKYILGARGRIISKPTEYLPYEFVELDKAMLENLHDVGAAIAQLIREGQTVPLRWLRIYNSFIDVEKANEGEVTDGFVD